jgi:hypothetical protein
MPADLDLGLVKTADARAKFRDNKINLEIILSEMAVLEGKTIEQGRRIEELSKEREQFAVQVRNLVVALKDARAQIQRMRG